MKNILSFKPGTKISGQEILDWANFQVINKTSHFKQGFRILKYFGNLRPERMYLIKTQFETFGRGDIRHKPMVIKAI